MTRPFSLRTFCFTLRDVTTIRDFVLRVANGARKVAAGLRPFSESVWPGVRNDLFVAHESVYAFFCRSVAGKRVLDAGCGTGYGSKRMADAGAAAVTGVDLDGANVRYASRHYRAPNLSYSRQDIEHLDFAPESFDVVVASNSLEHLSTPESFVASVDRVLAPGGTVIVAVPPIVSQDDLDAHSHIHYHRSNLTIRQWHDLFCGSGFAVSCFSHRPRSAAIRPDFASRAESRLTTDDFVFEKTDVDGLYAAPSVTALFELRRAGSATPDR